MISVAEDIHRLLALSSDNQSAVLQAMQTAATKATTEKEWLERVDARSVIDSHLPESLFLADASFGMGMNSLAVRLGSNYSQLTPTDCVLSGVHSLRQKLGTSPMVLANTLRATSQFVQGLNPQAVNLASTYYDMCRQRFGANSRESGRALVCLSAALLRANRWSEATRECERALKLLEEDNHFLRGFGYVTKGQIVQREGDHLGAADAFKRATLVFEGSQMPSNQISSLPMEAKCYALQADLTADPTEKRQLLKLAEATLRRANVKHQQFSQRRDTEMDQATAEIAVVRAHILARQSRFEDSIRILDKALATARRINSVGLLNNAQTAYVRIQTDRYLADRSQKEALVAAEREAQALIKTSAAATGVPPAIYATLGRIAEARQDRAAASQHYHEALQQWMGQAGSTSPFQSAFLRYELSNKLRLPVAGIIRNAVSQARGSCTNTYGRLRDGQAANSLGDTRLNDRAQSQTSLLSFGRFVTNVISSPATWSSTILTTSKKRNVL